VLSLLGSGAAGEVFLALDPFTQQQVAVKRMRGESSLNDHEHRIARRFFTAEAALVGRLQHPNVVQILDAVEDHQDPYIVMEYVPGCTLRHYCEPDHLLPLAEVIELGFKCAMALGYMSRQGLIHRDIKPGNVLIQLDGDKIVSLKIADFGTVFDTHAEVTQIQRVGTLAYMAPEQFQGKVVDLRADIYSLAAVLYHLVSGRKPFDSEHSRAVAVKLLFDPPASLLAARPGVTQALDQTIRQAMAKNPADRPATWEAFAGQLAALITHRQVPLEVNVPVPDSERFNLLRQLAFFADFDDVELWEVVHRASWTRFLPGEAVFRAGTDEQRFHILAEGEVEVLREGERVATLSQGTSVGEMAYLAPSDDLRHHVADVLVTQPCTTVSFTPASMASLSEATRHAFDHGFIQVLVRRLRAAHLLLNHPRKIQ
jgi:serine/threonine protein kinase